MTRIRRRRLLFGIAAAAAAGTAVIAWGLQQISPAQFTRSADQHYADVARHREAQRAQPSPDLVGQPVPAVGVSARSRPPVASSTDSTTDGAVSAPPYWTDFRGPERDGHYRQRPILTSWPERPLTPMWKQPVGGGYASFTAAHGRIFTIEQRGGQEVVAAYDLRSGRELWTHGWAAAFREGMGGDGPRATPTWHEGRLYALGATGELHALDDRRGRLLWRANILEDAGTTNREWGISGSPLIVDDTVVVLPGGPGGHSVAAYDRRTGARRWSALDDRQSYASPMLATIAGVRQILVFSESRLMGLTTDGGLLWEFPWRTGGASSINASQPIVLGNRVFISTGYGTGAAMVEVRREEDRLAVRELWRTIRMKNQFTSSVHHEGFIYGLDENILACIDAATGELKWKAGRYGYGQVVLAAGHLIVISDAGDLALVRATPERHVEIARFPALEGRSWNHPAIVDGILLIRNSNEMAAFDLNVR